MTNRKRNGILAEFIEQYRSYPCLWLVKSKDYHDRSKKSSAYANLVDTLRRLEPDATKEDVVKKINSLRSNVRKEKRKYEESIRMGAAPDTVPKPNLWYYNLFDFLEENWNEHSFEENSIQNQTANEAEELPEKRKTTTKFRITNTEPGPVMIPAAKTKSEREKLTHDVLMSVRNHFKRPAPADIQEDRYDLLGKTVALRMRTLEKRQRLIAEKIINDTLFEAEIGSLGTSSFRSSSMGNGLHYQHGTSGYSPGHSLTASRSPTYFDSSPTPSSSNSNIPPHASLTSRSFSDAKSADLTQCPKVRQGQNIKEEQDDDFTEIELLNDEESDSNYDE